MFQSRVKARPGLRVDANCNGGWEEIIDENCFHIWRNEPPRAAKSAVRQQERARVS